VALVLVGAVADFAESVEEYGAAERILLLTLVEADVATTTQLGVLQPLERKESPFQLSQFAQRERQAVLAGIGRELAQRKLGADPCDEVRFREDRTDPNDFRSGRMGKKGCFESVYGVDPIGAVRWAQNRSSGNSRVLVQL
jgi:hypothetical protein